VCTLWRSNIWFYYRGVFKTKASKVEKLFKAINSDISVSINAEKPRKGSFVVTLFRGDSNDGEKVIELLDMARPFTKLKALDLDKIVEDCMSASKS
jgi:hypothetical protein